jgi:hypothetical protein
MAKKRALIDAAQDPLAKKVSLPAPVKTVRKSHPVTIVLAVVVGLVGGFLMNRWLRIFI